MRQRPDLKSIWEVGRVLGMRCEHSSGRSIMGTEVVVWSGCGRQQVRIDIITCC